MNCPQSMLEELLQKINCLQNLLEDKFIRHRVHHSTSLEVKDSLNIKENSLADPFLKVNFLLNSCPEGKSKDPILK